MVFNGWSPDGSQPYREELRVIDLETGRIMAGRTLQPSEIFMQSLGVDTLYHIGELSGNSLVVRAYDYSLASNAASLTSPVGPSVSYLPPAGEATGFFNSIRSYTAPSA